MSASDATITPIPGVSFYPWRGDQWATPGKAWGTRLLLVGESHYDVPESEPDISSITNWVVWRYLDGRSMGGSRRFFTVVASLVSQRRLVSHPLAERACVWNDIAFYNYVSVSLRKNARPTPAEWLASQVPFQAVLDALQPTAILVLGKETWMHLPPFLQETEITVAGARTFQRKYAIAGAPPALAMHVQHPRWFKYARWTPHVQRLFADASAASRTNEAA